MLFLHKIRRFRASNPRGIVLPIPFKERTNEKFGFNLHSHSLLSDGLLLPSEVVVRYAQLGYKVIAITDHVDYSNITVVVKALLDFSQRWPKDSSIKVLAGIELTHLPKGQFKPLAKYARDQGIKVILAHGQTLVEPVIEGTNQAALEADIDILAHPGLISDDEVKLAKEKGIFLELTSRQGHNKTNLHVAKRALKAGAKLILNTDSHRPEDIISPQDLKNIGLKSGLGNQDITKIYQDLTKFLSAFA